MKRTPAQLLKLRNRELREARYRIVELSQTPGFPLSFLREMVKGMGNCKLGYTERFRQSPRFIVSESQFLSMVKPDRCVSVTKDVA